MIEDKPWALVRMDIETRGRNYPGPEVTITLVPAEQEGERPAIRIIPHVTTQRRRATSLKQLLTRK